MPIYMDRHALDGATPESLADLHQKDLACEDRFGVRCFTYWFDQDRQSVFCLMEAPSRRAVEQMHQTAHGLLPNQIIEVDSSTVASFLGRISDPEGSTEPIHEPGFRAMLMSDVADSTGMANRLGDDRAFELLGMHNALVRRALLEHGGREVDKAGDGFLACFPSVSKAVDAAIAIQRGLREYNAGRAAEPVRVRIGLGAGEPVTDGDDLFGSAVNLTARICSAAKPDQILVASVVRDLCLGRPHVFRDRGEVELKGFPEPVRLHEVEWV